jgi:cytochrome c-type biogenesis protein CcmH/NrfG
MFTSQNRSTVNASPLMAEAPIVLSQFRRQHARRQPDSNGAEMRIGLAIVALATLLSAALLTAHWPAEQTAETVKPSNASSLSAIYDTSRGVRRL